MYRQVFLLAIAQAMFQTASVMVVTVGSLAGAVLTPAPALATLPVASMFLGTAIATVPASMAMHRWGRRSGFLTGAALGTIGGLLAAAGIWFNSLMLLSAGTLLIGAYQGFAQFYRFAASEVADEHFRPQAISLVLAGGIIAAIAGPFLGKWGGELLQPAFTGSFLLLSLTGLISFAMLSGLSDPAAPRRIDREAESVRPLSRIVAQPAYLVALFGAATGYGVMILAMTATPLAMRQHGHMMDATALVIQLHVLGMFAPSFFTGSLIARFGVLSVMMGGVLLFAAHIALTLSGTGFYSFAAALIFLGVGWNFLYIGGTNLLTTTYTEGERSKAQAANDLSVFLVGLTSSLGAGVMHHFLGWQTLNLLLLPWIALAGIGIAWLAVSRRQQAAAGI